MTSQEIEIARQDGTEFRSVRVHARDDGAISLEAQDTGPRVEEIWGNSDYEFWVHVPAASLQKLAFELLREKYMDQWNAVNAFRDWCKTHGIEHEFGNYA